MLSTLEALRVARAECERRGLPFDEPVKIRRGLRRIRVWTKADAIGGNVVVSLHARSGAVVDVWTNPR